MNRLEFIRASSVTAATLLCAPNTILGQEDKPAAYQKEIVQSFVGAGHSNLDKVKELLIEFPNLIYCSNDWGNGDFETAIGAGGHVGHKEMVNFLIDKGTRPTLHALTMLGKTDLVVPIIEEYPQLINSLGPHGFTFLHHAQRGGDDSAQLLVYFETKGLKETKVPLK
ncbi:MAG: ankyrin repeat domain-containing protein [Bacteroidia bacterium]|nr:ankyrin repeat domain-containing protein [Bacteroidia bacterium]